MRGLSPVAASGGHSSSRCAGLLLSWPLLLRSTGSRRAGSVVVAHGPSCSAACGIFPDQGSNPCSLHWQADSQPLHHQGSLPQRFLLFLYKLALPPLFALPIKKPLAPGWKCTACERLFPQREVFVAHMRREHGKVSSEDMNSYTV